MAVVLIPTPRRDFDPSEVAVAWQMLTRAGHSVRFATVDGSKPAGDEMMLTGRGLDPWSRVPGLSGAVVVGRPLRADKRARAAYARMSGSVEFRNPIRWDAIDLEETDGLYLPGGHRARGMREYLESSVLQQLIVDAFQRGMPLAAVCHGVLLVARSIDSESGHSVLYGRKTTALTWRQERLAWHIARRTRFWDPDYYRTYTESAGQPDGYMSVQQEVTRALAKPQDFLDVTPDLPDARRKAIGLRDSATDERPAFVVQDGDYLSARWPGDVHTLARRFGERLSELDS